MNLREISEAVAALREKLGPIPGQGAGRRRGPYRVLKRRTLGIDRALRPGSADRRSGTISFSLDRLARGPSSHPAPDSTASEKSLALFFSIASPSLSFSSL